MAYTKILFPIFAFSILYINGSQRQQKSKVVQFDIDKILNARPVSTLSNNKLITWAKGLDGNGIGDGYLTMAATAFKGDKDAHALPDDPLFAANGLHPAIKLHYSNADSINNQACTVAGEDDIEFDVPKAKYTAIYLALTSAEGPSNLKIQLNYVNSIELKNFVLPDYYQDIKAGDPNLCYLAHDLAKWGNKNNMTEKDHHNIDLLKFRADPKKVLRSINISKTKPGYMVFWAAAGVKAG